MHERVVVAEREERSDGEAAGARGAVQDHDRILTLDEEERLLDPRAAGDREDPGWERVEAELDQVPVTLRMDRVRIGVCGELHVRLDHLFEAREQDVPLDGRTQGSDEEPVVAAGVRACHGARGESAGAVRLQPLEPRGALVIGARLARYR